jgi:siroheme synthase
MPRNDFGLLQERLLGSGLSSETPCAIVSGATSQSERVHITTVTNLADSPELAAPKLLVVGEVVRLASPDRLEQQVREFMFSHDFAEVSSSKTSSSMESAD